MNCTCIPYTRVPKASTLFTDYLYHFDRVSKFYNGAPFDPSSYRTVADKVKTSDRKKLAEILTRQNRAFGAGEPALANIRLLEGSIQCFGSTLFGGTVTDQEQGTFPGFGECRFRTF